MAHYIDHPLIKSNAIEARLYQQVLAADVLKKGNTMIVAPTALGKTIVATLVADRLEKVKNSKILVLAPSKPLAIQHESTFKEFLTVPCSSITGAVKTDERVKRWEESQIICATPQTVESDLLKGRYSLKDVSLVVFDECHHGVGSYSYVYLASRYVKESKFNLILGLTASPGSDKEKIKEVCDNLYIQSIVVKTEEDNDVRPYFNPVAIDWVRVKMSSELEKIKTHVDKALKIRLKGLKNMGVIRTVSVNKLDILKARGRVQSAIARSVNPKKECFQAISILSAVINIQHSQELIETQGVVTFNKYVARLRKKKTKAAKSLIQDLNFGKAIYLAREAEKHGLEHPKLKKVTDIIKKELGQNGQTKLQSDRYVKDADQKSSKIMVFTQYRDSLEMIHQKLEKEGIMTAQEFLTAVTKAADTSRYKNILPDKTKVFYQLQGYIYPDTYYLSKNITGDQLVAKILEEFDKKFDTTRQQKAAQLGMSVEEVLIRASLLQKETELPEEYPIIAGVIQNRLDKKMKLQFDSTAVYAITKGQYGIARVMYKDLEVDSPYNTYKYKGLPVGPICSPSLEAIDGVLNPQKNDYLYFQMNTVKNDGSNIFTKTYEEHKAASATTEQ